MNLQVNSVVPVQIFVAVALALASAVCYSAAAVLQHREVSVHVAGGLDLVARLARRRGWWAAVATTVIGAVLHLAALGTGPLLLVQPLGVTALVFALLIGARVDRTSVDRTAWLGAGCVVLGLPAVLLPTIPRQTWCSSTGGDGSSHRVTPAGCWNVTRSRTGAPSTPMRSATRTLRTCSKAGPISGQCRSCSATPISRRPRSTPT